MEPEAAARILKIDAQVLQDIQTITSTVWRCYVQIALGLASCRSNKNDAFQIIKLRYGWQRI